MSDQMRFGNMEDDETANPETTEPIPPLSVEELSDELFKDPDPDEELWIGGPTFGQIDVWKAQYEGQDVYVTSVTPEKHYIWRTILRSEYRAIVKELESKVASGNLTQAEATMDNEEAIARTCILYPILGDKDLGGVASLISQEVLEASAFQALEVRQL